MGRARELTMGNRAARRRAARTGYEVPLKEFTTDPAPNLEEFRALLERVSTSVRPLTFREGGALGPARRRFKALTGEWIAGAADPYEDRDQNTTTSG